MTQEDTCCIMVEVMCGVVAQLGARYHGTVEVVGSNPIDSTIIGGSRLKFLLPLFLVVFFLRIYGIEIFFDEEILPITLNLINSARESVKLVSFGVTHPDVVEALKSLEANGVKVTVVTDSESYCPLTHIVDTLPGLVHEKFLIIDSKTVLAGTMNFTVSGLKSDQNVAVLIEKSEAPEIFEAFLREFSNFQNGFFQNSKIPVKAESERVKLVFAPRYDPFQWISRILANARKEVLVAAYAFTDPQLTTVLKYLNSEGIDVKVLLDKRWNTENSYSEHVFLEGGIEVSLFPSPSHMHAKLILVDERWLLMGSANFTASARKKNDEFLMIIDSPELVMKARKWFFDLWKDAGSL